MKHRITSAILKTAIAFIVFTACAFPTIANAEWEWNDTTDVKKEFRKLIRTNLPKECAPRKDTDLFGYQSAWRDDENKKICYGMVLPLEKPCFDKLVQKLKKLKEENRLALRAKVPERIDGLFKSNEGPTIIFYFTATEADLRALDGH